MCVVPVACPGRRLPRPSRTASTAGAAARSRRSARAACAVRVTSPSPRRATSMWRGREAEARPVLHGGEGPACSGATGAVTRIAQRVAADAHRGRSASYVNDPNGDGDHQTDEGEAASARTASRRSSTDRLPHERRPDRAGDANGNLFSWERSRGAEPVCRTSSAALLWVDGTSGDLSGWRTSTPFERGESPRAVAIDTDANRPTSSSTAGASWSPTLAATAARGVRPAPLAPAGVPGHASRAVPLRVGPNGRHAGGADGHRRGPRWRVRHGQLTGFPFPVGARTSTESTRVLGSRWSS